MGRSGSVLVSWGIGKNTAIALSALLMLQMQSIFALDYKTSWVGNSFGGADEKWVQNYIIHMNVTRDGTCNTWSHWDEGGKNYGIYKDGDIIGNENKNPNSLKVKDKNGRTWEILFQYTETYPEMNEYEITPLGIACDGTKVDFPGLFEPMALALANDGTLMIGDSQTSPRQQILFYDISNWQQPKLVRTFGDSAGIASGTPGEITPTKFWGIRAIGMDSADNIYVGISEQGSEIRKLTPEGTLVWSLYCNDFVDVKVCDPATDCREVWGIQEHYVMDYSKSAGKEATWVDWTLDRHKYPSDPRGIMAVKAQFEHGMCTPLVVYLEGKRFLYVTGMTCNFINIYRFDGRIAVPSGIIMQLDGHLFNSNVKWPDNEPTGNYIWRDVNGDGQYQANEYFDNIQKDLRGPVWIDKQGNVWLANGLYRYEFQGLDSAGNPIYTVDKCTQMPKPDGVSNPIRVMYDTDRDLLVTAENAGGNFHIRQIAICKDYMQGSRATVTFTSGAGGDAGCLAVAGEYVFSAGWQQRGKVFINKLSDGSEVGVLTPGPEVGGLETTGWVDIMMGINAFLRSTGEYIIFLEDDYRAKSIMYRWTPDGVVLKPETGVGAAVVQIPARPSAGMCLYDVAGRKAYPVRDGRIENGVRNGVYITREMDGARRVGQRRVVLK
jgi:hypothetical protein